MILRPKICQQNTISSIKFIQSKHLVLHPASMQLPSFTSLTSAMLTMRTMHQQRLADDADDRAATIARTQNAARQAALRRQEDDLDDATFDVLIRLRLRRLARLRRVVANRRNHGCANRPVSSAIPRA
jgi:hypothetical protein